MNPLGEKVESFRPMLGNVIAGFILGLLAGGAGVAALTFVVSTGVKHDFDVPFHAENGPSWLGFILFALIGVVLLGVGIGFTLYSRGLISVKVDLHENGLRIRGRRSLVDVKWSDVAKIQEVTISERLPILTGPAKLAMPNLASKRYVVFMKSGEQHDFDGNSIKAINRFGRMLREESEPESVPWERAEMG